MEWQRMGMTQIRNLPKWEVPGTLHPSTLHPRGAEVMVTSLQAQVVGS